MIRPTAVDVQAAGRDYPQPDLEQPLTAVAFRGLLQDRRAWWLDVAEAYLILRMLAPADRARRAASLHKAVA